MSADPPSSASERQTEPPSGPALERLVVVTPCFNEEAVVARFHEAATRQLEALEGLDYRILFVDDGSSDGTLEELNALRARDPRVQVSSLSRNFGHQIALTAGLAQARGDAVILMDSDLQHPPELIPRLVDEWRQGHDVVSAVRRDTADGSVFKNFSSRVFYWLIGKLSDTPIEPGAADFCLLSHRAQQALQRMPEHHRFLRGMVSWVGFPRAFVYYDAPARVAGESKYDLRRMVRLALDAVFSFSVTPIRLMRRFGLILIALGFVYLFYIILRFFVLRDLEPGWGSVISTVVILGGMQLASMGIIGEYLARVFEEVKARPLYLLKQEAVDSHDDSVPPSDAAKDPR